MASAWQKEARDNDDPNKGKAAPTVIAIPNHLTIFGNAPDLQIQYQTAGVKIGYSNI